MTALRLGVVRYLNARPLYEGIEAFAPGVELVSDVPSRLAEGLRLGSLDVALVPSIEYFRQAERGWKVVPELAIAARGAVRSVKLLCRTPFADIRRLALDEGSRTSQALARVWLEAAHGVRPQRIEPLPLGMPAEESLADAVLVIGDRAMTVNHEGFRTVVDLGQAWYDLTGLPFVFALWVARDGVELVGLPEALVRCRDRNLADVEALSDRHARRMGLDQRLVRDYLTHAISYELGGPEVAGLRDFRHRAAALGLAPEDSDLVFTPSRFDLAARP